MNDIEEVEIAVLQVLIFPESLQTVKDECFALAQAFVIPDVLKSLIHDDYVYPLLPNEEGKLVRSLGYDSDKMEDYRFQLTAKGLELLGQNRKA